MQLTCVLQNFLLPKINYTGVFCSWETVVVYYFQKLSRSRRMDMHMLQDWGIAKPKNHNHHHHHHHHHHYHYHNHHHHQYKTMSATRPADHMRHAARIPPISKLLPEPVANLQAQTGTEGGRLRRIGKALQEMVNR